MCNGWFGSIVLTVPLLRLGYKQPPIIRCLPELNPLGCFRLLLPYQRADRCVTTEQPKPAPPAGNRTESSHHPPASSGPQQLGRPPPVKLTPHAQALGRTRRRSSPIAASV